jgi:ribulose-phosphate 3-epimerase
MYSPVLAPSLLSADFAELGEALAVVKESNAPVVHIDVMDGAFVPEITYGQPVVRSLRPRSSLIFDVHLMVERPENQVDSFAEAGADWITFHAEAAVHGHRLTERIHSLGKKAGVAIVPSTPAAALAELLPFVDLVLVMTVNPGFGGQKLIPRCVEKAAALTEIRRREGYGYKVSVDGGVDEKTAPLLIAAGVDILVSGSAFFSGRLRDLSRVAPAGSGG